MKSLFTVLLGTCLTMLCFTTDVSAQNQAVDPIYGKSFVGIWKRMFVSGRPEQNMTLLICNENKSIRGHVGPGNRKIAGYVKAVKPNPGYPQKGTLIVDYNGRETVWSYTLNRNNGFKSEFRPLGRSNRNAPVLNELLLVGQGTRQLYAFLSYPFQRICVEKDVLRMLQL